MNFFCKPHLTVLLLLLPQCSGFAQTGATGKPAAFLLQSSAAVDSSGVFLHEIVQLPVHEAFPRLRIGDAPAFGQDLFLTREQVLEKLRATQPDLVTTNWSGAKRVRISRCARSLGETELVSLLTEALQRELFRDKGELEISLTRTWTPASVPDESLQLKLLDFPATGVPTKTLLLRFELRSERESFGPWQTTAHARLWRDVYVTPYLLKRGHIVSASDFRRERKDLLSLRNPALTLPEDEPIEMLQSLPAGEVLTERAFRLKPAVMRGQVVAGLVQDGSMTISLKVEVLEDGLTGQLVRVRNLQSKRELRGKVQNEQSILISL
jgi:flagellar basal body P-ring formation protein FlgA